MSKKLSFLVFRCSLLLVCSVVAPGAFAAGVETVGDLKVGGVIESTSGGFKFPDGTTWTTGSMDGLHFNVGFVVDDSDSNTGNLTSGAIKFGTGATGEGIASQRTAGDNNNGLDFYTNSTARLSIANNGNVGIGTRTPAARLQVLSSDIVQAQFGAHPIYLQNADAGGTSLLGFNLYWGPASNYVYGSSHTGATINNYSGGLAFGLAAAGTAGGSPAGGYPTWVMRMTSEGKVRIGDLGTPSETLDVAGNIKASGTVSAQGISMTTGATSGHVLTSDASGNSSWQVPLPPTKVGTSTSSISPSSTCSITYTPSAVLTVTPERSGLLNLTIQGDYNFYPRYMSQAYAGIYISTSSAAPTCSSAFAAYARVGWAGSLASSTFGGDIPVSYFHQLSVTAGSTYYIWVGIDGVNFDYTNQTGIYSSHKIMATLNQSTGL